MNARHALLYGLTAALRQNRMVLALYLLSLLFGLLLLLPVLPLIDGALGHRITGTGIESQLDVAIIADLLRTHAAEFNLFHRIASVLFVVHLALATFLSGGVLTLLLSPRGQGWLSKFLAGCGRYFGRFGRLVLFHLAFLVVAAAANHGANLLVPTVFEDSTHATLATLAMWLKQFLMILVVLALATVFDYARVLTALQDRRAMTGALVSAVAFVARNIGAVISLRLLVMAGGGAAILMFWTTSRWILPQSSWLLLVLLQQMVVLFQKFLTVLLYAAELNLYRGRELSEDARLLSRLTDPEALRSALT
jgi:hypothetical protein